ncbi:acetate/propionate family kinase [Lujinxingia litoralis]|uniref:Acetate kinase n=1 Tax=Lujinxingia litoralis TaxID=2211119 RepID=A0A328C8A9_9DELT|nr:acetate/propionate family kinase [Lujinxingia litoralis]RAL24837.1 acetate/propionate family kinase [Lujinxingia litoralis]
MQILVINCGSSSLKADVREHATGEYVAKMVIDRVGSEAATLRFEDEEPTPLPGEVGHKEALEISLTRLLQRLSDPEAITAIGHRVVHGGARFTRPVLIDDQVEAAIEELSALAPLHNPANLAGIRAARALLPSLPHVAVFDTAFHATLPRRARVYALPHELAEDPGLRRFGFHGISHAYVARQAANYLDADMRDLRLITCHLGNGASVCAVEFGRSIETSMGLTPLEGLVMGTRSGDIDPGLLFHLMREYDYSAEELDHLLNHKSGLAGLSGIGNDLRDIEARAAEGDEHCRLAIQVFAHRVRKYIGAYAAIMGGVDAIVFTAGIGENSALMRHRIAQRLDFLGARHDEDRNRELRLPSGPAVERISTPHSRTHLLVARTDESRAIAEATSLIVLKSDAVARAQRPIPVAVSARHIHLTQEAVETLFGPGYQLTPRNDLSQPGQFAAEETLRVVGPKNEFPAVRILGPTRSLNQLEISRTDEFALGIDAPVRASGDVANSPGILLVGPAGELKLEQGVICAWRHIHMTPDDAAHFGVHDRDVVEVAITGGDRDLTFGDVLVRVKDSYRLEMHIDTDEGNAANLGRGATGTLISTEGRAQLQRRATRYDTVDAAAE